MSDENQHLTDINENEMPASDLIKVSGRRTNISFFPLDKINSNWNRFISSTPDGQLYFNFDTTASNDYRDEKALISFALSFDMSDVHISKSLSSFDKRVYLAIYALYRAGNIYQTAQQIYRAMGCNGIAGKRDKIKIDSSIKKLMSIHTVIDNSIEVKTAKYKYPLVVVETQLLNAVRTAIVSNGQTIDSAYKICDEPILIAFARGRNQIAEVDIDVLRAPLRKTDQTIVLEDYLIERIERARSGHGKKSILLETLFSHVITTNGNERLQKSRALVKLPSLLEYYKSVGYISSYQIDSTKLDFEL